MKESLEGLGEMTPSARKEEVAWWSVVRGRPTSHNPAVVLHGMLRDLRERDTNRSPRKERLLF